MGKVSKNAIIILAVILLVLPVVSVAYSTGMFSETIHAKIIVNETLPQGSILYALSDSWIYHSTAYNTYVFWSATIFFNSLSYSVGLDSHIYFTNISLTSSSNPKQSFGIVSKGGNITITQITSSDVIFSETSNTGQTENLTFYFSTQIPSSVLVGSTNILQTSYLTSYSSWVAAVAPSVFLNQTARSLTVKANGSPTVSFAFTSLSSLSQTSASHSSSVHKYLSMLGAVMIIVIIPVWAIMIRSKMKKS